MHSVMHTLGKYRADTAAARCAVCGAAARRLRVVARAGFLGGPKKRRRAEDTEDEDTCGRPAAGSTTC